MFINLYDQYSDGVIVFNVKSIETIITCGNGSRITMTSGKQYDVDEDLFEILEMISEESYNICEDWDEDDE